MMETMDEEGERGLINSSPFQRKSSVLLRGILGTLIGTSILIIILLIVVISQNRSVIQNQKDGSSPNNIPPAPPINPVVENAVLKELATNILSAMDQTADPCQDFYQYACGQWSSQTKLPEDSVSWTKSFSVIADDNNKVLRDILEGDWPLIGTLYKNCMDMETVNGKDWQPISLFFEKIDSVVSLPDLFSAIGFFHKNSFPMFFSFFVDADAKNPTKYLPQIWQGGLGLPNRDYYISQSSSFQTIRDAYILHVAKVFQLIGVAEEAAKQGAQKVFNLESRLANYSLSPAEERDPNLIYNKLSWSQFISSSNLEWAQYFSALNAVVTELNVGMPKFVQGLNDIIPSSNLEDLKLYMKWNIIRSSASLLSQKFLDENFAWSKTLYGTKQPSPRWKTCIRLTDNLLGDLLGRYFVDRKFPGNSKGLAKQLVNALQQSFGDNLQNLDWMDSQTKAAAKIKLDMISNKIGYPDKWKQYSEIFIAPGELFGNYLAIQAFFSKLEIQKIGKDVDKAEWFMTPSTVNAYYNPSGNEIVFPAAILQPPFFNQSYPAFANFGGIGSVIGHEITHGFDDQGSQYDGTGKLVSWWSPSVQSEFDKKAQCVVDYYANYQVLPGLHINGKLTEGENLADLGGLRIAYNAYKKWIQKNGENFSVQEFSKYFPNLNPEKLFFISFGQLWCSVQTDGYTAYLTNTNPHSLAPFRVRGATSNFDAFWKAFECSAGTQMHPENSCRVW